MKKYPYITDPDGHDLRNLTTAELARKHKVAYNTAKKWKEAEGLPTTRAPRIDLATVQYYLDHDVPIKQIAQILDVNVNTLYAKMYKHGMYNPRKKHLREKRKSEVRELYAAGNTIRQITETTGIPRSTVSRWLI